MGQATSKNQGTLTFGYVASNTTITITNNSSSDTNTNTNNINNNNSDNDLVLTQPHLFALAELLLFPQLTLPSSPASPTTTLSSVKLGRVDSGYNEQVHNNNNSLQQQQLLLLLLLEKELTYVDTTYYNHKNTQVTSRSNNNTSKNNISNNDNDQTDINPIKTKMTTTNTINVRFTFLDAYKGSVDKSMQEIDLSGRRLINLSCNIARLNMIRKLDLSYNQLVQLPDAIGHLENLEYLRLSHNQLESIPDTIIHLSKLTELDLSNNHIHDLTPCLSIHLKKLHTLDASRNHISYLSYHISNMNQLATLDLSNNPIQVLPAELAQLPYLRQLLLDNCPLKTKEAHSYSLLQSKGPPSLLETCARIIVREKQLQQHSERRSRSRRRLQKQKKHQQDIYSASDLPPHLIEYLQSAKVCSSCHGPYFDTFVTRGQWVEKSEIMVPLEHRLCTAHWINEDDRILNMFAEQPLPKPISTTTIMCSPTVATDTYESSTVLDDISPTATTTTTTTTTNNNHHAFMSTSSSSSSSSRSKKRNTHGKNQWIHSASRRLLLNEESITENSIIEKQQSMTGDSSSSSSSSPSSSSSSSSLSEISLQQQQQSQSQSQSHHTESDSITSTSNKLLSRWKSQHKKVNNNNHRSGFLALSKLKRQEKPTKDIDEEDS